MEWLAFLNMNPQQTSIIQGLGALLWCNLDGILKHFRTERDYHKPLLEPLKHKACLHESTCLLDTNPKR